MGSEYATGGEVRSANGLASGEGVSLRGSGRKKGLVRAGVDRAIDWVSETSGLFKGERARF